MKHTEESKTTFKYFGQYNLWAGKRIRALVSKLTKKELNEKVGAKTARGLSEHIVLALETCFYIADESSDRTVFEAVEKYSMDDLLGRWARLDTRLSKIIAEIPQGKIMVPHLTDNPFEMDVLDFYLQYLFHNTHHRGQLAMTLRALGKEIPGTDYLMFFAENPPA